MGGRLSFEKYIEWMFYGLMSGVAIYAVRFLSHLSASIDELNLKMGTIIERTTWHEKWLERHDEEINKMRNHKGE